MRTLFVLWVSLSLCLPSICLADEADIIGSIRTSKGKAEVLRDDKAMPAKVGLRLLLKDILQTGADGQLGVILRDDTLLSLGPDTKIVVNQFAFAPAQGHLALVVKLFKGMVAFLSGQISKLSPESARLETPVATVGIRGTRFLVKLEEE
ncbi:MAG: FecR family protein [Desulfobacterales bacterium]